MSESTSDRSWRYTLRHGVERPPDGGAVGAAVVAATFVVYAIVVGLEAVFGVLIAVILRGEAPREGATYSSLAAVGSISVFMELALGVPVGQACDRYGVRSVCAVGGALMGAGLVASSLATRVETLYLTYSGLVGAGMACAYGAASMGVGMYFTTRSAFANSVAGVGVGVGTIVLSFAIEGLTAWLDWRGCLRLLGFGFAILTILASAAYVPIRSLATDEAAAPNGDEAGAGVAGASVAAALAADTDSSKPAFAAPPASGVAALEADNAPLRRRGDAAAVVAAPLTAFDVLQSEARAREPALPPLKIPPQLRQAAAVGRASASPLARSPGGRLTPRLTPLHLPSSGTRPAAVAGDADDSDEEAAPAASVAVTVSTPMLPHTPAVTPRSPEQLPLGLGAQGALAAQPQPQPEAQVRAQAQSQAQAAATRPDAVLAAASARVATFRQTPLSPFLFAGAQSAASVVPALSLRSPALRALVRVDGARAAYALRQRAASVVSSSPRAAATGPVSLTLMASRKLWMLNDLETGYASGRNNCAISASSRPRGLPPFPSNRASASACLRSCRARMLSSTAPSATRR
jgi:MFS family permease